jgi:RNA polymerase sigma-70 factor (ECF subfamily)
VLASVVEAEDILQAAYPDAVRRWETFATRRLESPSASAYVWLYGIVMGRLSDEFLHHTRGVRDQRLNMPWPEASSIQLGLSLVDVGRSPLSALVAADASERMRQALEQLPDSDREVLWLRHFEGMSFKDIAEHQVVEENTAVQRYVRALRKLRGIWKLLEPADGSRL